LGSDLLRINRTQRVWTVLVPFVCVAGYFWFASVRWWPLAVLCLFYLSFITYGSTSHDLVHRTLGLPRAINEFFLTTIELLAFRSGHAYRQVHLHHHARFPHDDDIEGAAAKMTFFRAIIEGMIFQPRIMLWAIKHSGRTRSIVFI